MFMKRTIYVLIANAMFMFDTTIKVKRDHTKSEIGMDKQL